MLERISVLLIISAIAVSKMADRLQCSISVVIMPSREVKVYLNICPLNGTLRIYDDSQTLFNPVQTIDIKRGVEERVLEGGFGYGSYLIPTSIAIEEKRFKRSSHLSCYVPLLRAEYTYGIDKVVEGSLSFQPEWMGEMIDIIGSRTLTSLAIPGTHDSGSFFRGAHVIGDMLYAMRDTQQENIFTQLLFGIRFFDLRACNHFGNYDTCHGPLQGIPMDIVFKEVKFFLDKFPTEVVILNIHHKPLFYMDYESFSIGLENLIKEILGPYLDEPGTHIYKRSFSDIVKSGKRAIVAIQYPSETSLYQAGPKVRHLWGNTDNNEKLTAYLLKAQWKFRDDNFRSSMAALTAQGLFKNLAEFATSFNPYFSSWLRVKPTAWYTANIIAVDFFESTDIVNICKFINLEKKEFQNGGNNDQVKLFVGISPSGEVIYYIYNYRDRCSYKHLILYHEDPMGKSLSKEVEPFIRDCDYVQQIPTHLKYQEKNWRPHNHPKAEHYSEFRAKFFEKRLNIVSHGSFRIYPQWIEDMLPRIGQFPLYMLAIPGTHHSGLYPSMNVPLELKHRLRQTEDVYTQLIHGIRSLDFSIEVVDGSESTFWIHDGVYRYNNFEDILMNITAFLDEYRFEVIFIEIRNLKEFRRRHGFKLHRMLQPLGVFEQREYYNETSLMDVLSKNYRVVVTCDALAYLFPGLYFRGLRRVEAYEQENWFDFLTAASKEMASKEKLFAITVQMDDHPPANFTGNFVGSSLEANFNLMCSYVYNDALKRSTNIISVDFFKSSNVINIARQILWDEHIK